MREGGLRRARACPGAGPPHAPRGRPAAAAGARVYHGPGGRPGGGLSPAARSGVYRLRAARGTPDVVVVLPTMYRWIRSDRGREATLHPYRSGHFPGSGQGAAVLAEAGLDGVSQYEAVRAFADSLVRPAGVS